MRSPYVQLSLLDALVPDIDFVVRHQVGQIRLPWDTAGGDKAGDLIPAWRCCYCGAIELSEHMLLLDHGCEDRPRGCPGCCQYTPPEHQMHPYRMDAHWIPPVAEVAHA